jgi:DNA-directed RNA polymerase subunit K/omega
MADLEEVDVEQQLKQAEESGDETGSIILSEKSDIDSDDDEEEEDMQLDEDNKINEDDMGKESDIEDNDDEDDNDEGVDTYIPQQVEVDDKDGQAQAPLISGDVPQGMLDQLDEISSDDEEDSDDEEYNENMRKLENDINKDYLYSYHPETKHINYKELLTLSNVTRNKKGIIIDPLHTTIPILTRYEKAKILGLRAKQINHGAKPFVELTKDIIDGHTIAFMELTQNKIPFIIRRPMPNGGSEYWKISDLKNID